MSGKVKQQDGRAGSPPQDLKSSFILASSAKPKRQQIEAIKSADFNRENVIHPRPTETPDYEDMIPPSRL